MRHLLWRESFQRLLPLALLLLAVIMPEIRVAGKAVSDAAGLLAAVDSGVQHILITDHLNFTALNHTRSLQISEATKSLRVRISTTYPGQYQAQGKESDMLVQCQVQG
jgi:hypothetical protein